jgi:hypothetical protein
MRWWLLGLLVLGGCPDSDDTSTDTGSDTDTGDTGGTDDSLAWTPLRVETSSALNAVYVGGSGAFVVGEDGTAWDVTPGLASLMLTGVTGRLTGLWGQGAGPAAELLAVGYGGRVLRRAGRTWIVENHEGVGSANFEDIGGVKEDLTAVAISGAYRFREGVWTFENNLFNRAMRSVYVTPEGEAWAVGEGGAIAVRQNNIWYEVPAPTQADLLGIHGSGEYIFAVGVGGTVLQWNGNVFEELDVPTTANLQAVWVAPTGKAYIVGNNGAAFRVDPPEFDEEDGSLISEGGVAALPVGRTDNLYDVSGTDERNVWAVGNRGAIFRFKAEYVVDPSL